MRSLSFSALLSRNSEVEMKETTTPPPAARAIDTPLTFDFDFEFDEPKLTLDLDTDAITDCNDVELRSPRTPTFKGDSVDASTEALFDPDKFFKFPLLSSPSDLSPLMALSVSPPARAHINSDSSLSSSKQKLKPLAPPPKTPLLWVWICHLCHSRYPLGATRRCLVDGHLYCSGNNSASTQRNVKKKKRGQACSSEFDYLGWQEWGVWKKQVTTIKKQALAGSSGAHAKAKLGLRGCEACEYPSQCRYEKFNKVPDIVASMSKNANQDTNAKTKTPNISKDTTHKATVASPKKLKIDTDTNTQQRSKLTEKEPTKPGHEHVRKHEDQLYATHGKRAGCKIQSPQPTSPDLVDFLKLHSVSGQLEDGEAADKARDVDVMLVDSGLDSGVDGSIASGEDDQSGTASTRAVALMGLPELRRTGSRKRDSLRGNNDKRQSRISDFFGIRR